MRNSKKNQKLFKVIRIAAIVLLAVLMVAMVYLGSLPKQYDVYQGQTSEYDITASRTVTDTYETERRARIAKTEVAPIYVMSESVSAKNKETVDGFFSYCEELRKSNIDEVGVVIRNKEEMASLLKKAVKESYDIELADDVADDYDLLLLFRQYRKAPSMDIVVDIAINMLGEKQHRALMDFCRDEHGKLKTSAMMTALEEIENAIPSVKN